MEVISRADAKAKGLPTYFTGKPCKHGHVEQRFTQSGDCRECARLKSAKGYRDNLDLRREQSSKAQYKRRYGLEYESVLEMKDQSCGICGEVKNRMVIDHCHTTGAVRGTLCHACNTGLGKLGDTEEGLMRAVEYLRRNRRFVCEASALP